MKQPIILRNLLNESRFKTLQEHVKGLDKSSLGYSKDFNRYEWGNDPLFTEIHQELLPVAKEFFESDVLVPSFNFGSWYFGNASLEKHKDVNACTYSIDLCVYQNTPWDLYIEGVPYTLNENDAVLYYGEEQRHWREDFPNPGSNVVCNVFFFYVEPTHWFITEPLDKHDDIRRQNGMERNYSGR